MNISVLLASLLSIPQPLYRYLCSLFFPGTVQLLELAFLQTPPYPYPFAHFGWRVLLEIKSSRFIFNCQFSAGDILCEI